LDPVLKEMPKKGAPTTPAGPRRIFIDPLDYPAEATRPQTN
jgi:hypothetical protein